MKSFMYHYVECYCAERILKSPKVISVFSLGNIMLSGIVLIPVMLCFNMKSVICLSILMLSIIILGVIM